MKSAHLIEENKKLLLKKLKDLQDAEAEIVQIISNVTQESKDCARKLLEIKSKSKVLKEAKTVIDKVDGALYQLFNIKALITAENDDYTSSGESSSENGEEKKFDNIESEDEVQPEHSKSIKQNASPNKFSTILRESERDKNFIQKTSSFSTYPSSENSTSLPHLNSDKFNLDSLSNIKKDTSIQTSTQQNATFESSRQSICDLLIQNSKNYHVVIQSLDEQFDPENVIEPPTNSPALSLSNFQDVSCDFNSSFIKTTELVPGTILNTVYVTEVESPSLFWIRIESKEFDIFDKKLQLYGKSSKKCLKYSPGTETVCCVQSNLDDCWYRCKTMKWYKDDELSQNFFVDVFYVDFGKIEYNVPSVKTRILPEIFYSIDKQAVRCKLAKIYPKSGVWKNEDIHTFKKLTLPEEFKATVLAPSSSTEPYSVELLNLGCDLDIGQELVKCSIAEYVDCIKTDQMNSPACQHEQLKFNNSDSDDCLEKSNIPYPIIGDPSSIFLIRSHIESLTELYFHQVNEESAKMDNFEDKLNNWCESFQDSYDVKDCDVQVDSCWAVFYSETKRWHRIRIVQKLKNQECLVFFVDYGDKAKVKLNQLRPLSKALTLVPAHAVLASLYGIIPDDDEDIKDTLLQVIPLNTRLRADIMSRLHDGLVGLCLSLLLWNEEPEEQICINSVLLKVGIAKSDVVDLSKQFIPSDEEVDEVLDHLDEWDPMTEEFQSELNTYQLDKGDPGVVLTGYKAKNILVCRKFNEGYCPRGDSCHFKHISYENAVTSAEKFTTIVEGKLLVLPADKSLVAVNISTCQTPSHFYVIFPYGPKSVTELKKNAKRSNKADEDLEDMTIFNKEFKKFCDKLTFHGNRGVLPAIGSLVAVKTSFNGDWRRAKILEVDAENKETNVFYVDYGDTDIIPFKDLHEIDTRFIHLPCQAVECFVPDIVPVEKSWSQESILKFKELCEGKTLIAYVFQADESNVLHIKVYDTTGSEDVDVSQELIKQNLAKRAPTTDSEFDGTLASHPNYYVPG